MGRSVCSYISDNDRFKVKDWKCTDKKKNDCRFGLMECRRQHLLSFSRTPGRFPVRPWRFSAGPGRFARGEGSFSWVLSWNLTVLDLNWCLSNCFQEFFRFFCSISCQEFFRFFCSISCQEFFRTFFFLFFCGFNGIFVSTQGKISWPRTYFENQERVHWLFYQNWIQRLGASSFRRWD